MFRVFNKLSRNSTARILSAQFLLIGVSAMALTAATTAAQAQSQPTTGFYIGGAAGMNLEENNRFRNGGGNSTDTYD